MRSLSLSVRNTVCCVCCFIVLCVLGTKASTLPPDPNNAALLYYQAMLILPELDDTTGKALDAVLRGAEPNEVIRTYLKRCRESIEFIEAGVRLSECDWGKWYSNGFRTREPQLKQLHMLSRLLRANALVLAWDGNYRSALERCLMMRRFAQSTGDDSLHLYLMSHYVDKGSQICIQRILSSMPVDAGILTWLQGQLAIVRGAPQSPAKALEIDLAIVLQNLRLFPQTLARIRDQLVEKAENESEKRRMRNLTDEELLARAEKPYAAFLDSALRVMNNKATFDKKDTEIERLTRKLEDEFSNDPAANEIIVTYAEQVLGLYRLQVNDTVRFNALRAAVAVYIETTKIGRLPEKLPSGLPKDPYSEQDFEYERTEEGFVLRSQAKTFNKSYIGQYEFKVRELQ